MRKTSNHRLIIIFFTLVILSAVCISACERKNDGNKYQEDWDEFCLFLEEQPEILDYRIEFLEVGQRGRVNLTIYVDYREWDDLPNLIEHIVLPRIAEEGIILYMDEQVKDVPIHFIFSPRTDVMTSLYVYFSPSGYKTAESPYFSVVYCGIRSLAFSEWQLERRIDDGGEYKEYITVDTTYKLDEDQ